LLKKFLFRHTVSHQHTALYKESIWIVCSIFSKLGKY